MYRTDEYLRAFNCFMDPFLCMWQGGGHHGVICKKTYTQPWGGAEIIEHKFCYLVFDVLIIERYYERS